MNRRPERAPGGDRGDTLVEILVALAVLGIGVTALLVALAANASTTVINRDQAQAETALLAAAEWVKALAYPSCTGSGITITPAQVPRATGFTINYGPAGALVTGTPCETLAKVRVTVTGNGFTLTLDVVRRA